MAIPDKKMKSNPQGSGTQGPNRIAERDARARKARAGGMKQSGGGSAPVKRTQSTRPGRETTTAGQARYDSPEDRWARMTGTGRYDAAHAYDRMTGTGEFADGGGAEERLNRQRMFGQADADARYRAGGPARRERALGGMADFRQESGANSFGGVVAGRSMDRRLKKAGQQNRKAAPRRSASPPPTVTRTFGGGSIGADGSYNLPNYGG